MLSVIESYVLLAVGTIGLVYALAQLRKARESEYWPVYEAVVLDSTMRMTRSRRGPGYSPEVRYEYRHNGVAYQGARIMFSGLSLSSSREDVEQFLQPLAKGTRIHVRVSPRDPRVSVIEPGVEHRLKMLLFVTAYLILMGGGGLLGWWK